VFWAKCKRNEVILYYERTEKTTEHRRKLRQLRLYQTFSEIGQEKKIIHQLKKEYNSKYPNNSIPNEVFKPKDYYRFMKDK
jgi:hypothetical protein